MAPFQYPDQPYSRRHGPQGYAAYESYRPWLRDEFTFCCVFCLKRERWGHVLGEHAIDHFQPMSVPAALATEYDNPLYVCARCNLAKRDQEVPDPTVHLTTDELRLHPDGRLEGLTRAAKRLIAKLDLDSPRARPWRLIWIRNVELARQFDLEPYARLVGFPDDLPYLSTLMSRRAAETCSPTWKCRRPTRRWPKPYWRGGVVPSSPRGN